MKLPQISYDTMKNTCRNILLVILVLLLALQTLMMWEVSLRQLGAASSDGLLSRILALLPVGDGGYVQHVSESAAAYPAAMAITMPDGTLHGVAYNEAATGSMYEAVKPVLSRALTNASVWEAAQEQELEQALQGQTLFVGYDAHLPLYLVASWLDAHAQSGAYIVGNLILVRDGRLFLRDRADGMLYISNTSVADEQWQAIQEAAPNIVCDYAVTLDLPVYAETVLPQEAAVYDILSATAPAFGSPDSGDSMQMLLEAFHYSAYVKNDTVAGGSAQIFVENYGTLRVGRNGTVSYRANADTGGLSAYQAGELDEAEALAARIDYALQIVEAAIRSLQTSEGACALDSVQLQNDVCVLKFIRTVQGVPVRTGSEFARMEFHAGTLVSAEIALQGLQYTGERLYILPAQQAAAASANAAATWRVAYQYSGEDRLAAASLLE